MPLGDDVRWWYERLKHGEIPKTPVIIPIFNNTCDLTIYQNLFYYFTSFVMLWPQPSLTVMKFQAAHSTKVKTWEMKRSVDPVETNISIEQCISSVGHYCTAILHDDVAHLQTQLLNLPIQCGFASDHWTRSVTPLIGKDKGQPYLTWLHVIHMFEADHNIFLKIIFGRRMVKNAELANARDDQQHGSSPCHMTTDALIFARLEKDITICQMKMNGAHMDNNATGCYDWIITSLGMIACWRLQHDHPWGYFILDILV